MNIWFIIIAVMVLSFLVQSMLTNRFKKYSEVPTSNGMSGAEIAAKMLRDNGITDVQIVSIDGKLTDHYNPETKTVNLSEAVYPPTSAGMWCSMPPVTLPCSCVAPWCPP